MVTKDIIAGNLSQRQRCRTNRQHEADLEALAMAAPQGVHERCNGRLPSRGPCGVLSRGLYGVPRASVSSHRFPALAVQKPRHKKRNQRLKPA